MACGKHLAKRLLILFNLIFVLGGLILFAIGIWIKCDATVINNLDVINVQQAKPLLNYASTIFIIVGIVTFIVAIIGLFGALREHQGLLFLFAVLVMFVIVVECGAAVLTLFFRVQMGSKLSMSMQMQTHYLYGYNPVKTSAWDVMQSNIKCCGGNTYNEYYHSTWYNISRKQDLMRNGTKFYVPASCCVSKELEEWTLCQNDAASRAPTSEYLYTKGCYGYLLQWFHTHSTILIIVGFITALIQVMTFMMACCLRGAIKQSAKI